MEEILFKNKTHISDKEYLELHDLLAKTVIDFFKEKGLPEKSWAINFSFDCLEESVKAGQWVPASDSSLCLTDDYREILVQSM